MSFVDPPEAPEGGNSIRAKDLVNKVCLFRPQSLGEWPAKPAELDEDGNIVKRAQGPQTYVECDVWVLDRAGILEEGSGVRVGWWKAVEQLKGSMGTIVGGKPTQEAGGNAIYLATLTGEARKVAGEAVATIEAGPVYAEGEEPFANDGDVF